MFKKNTVQSLFVLYRHDCNYNLQKKLSVFRQNPIAVCLSLFLFSNCIQAASISSQEVSENPIYSANYTFGGDIELEYVKKDSSNALLTISKNAGINLQLIGYKPQKLTAGFSTTGSSNGNKINSWGNVIADSQNKGELYGGYVSIDSSVALADSSSNNEINLYDGNISIVKMYSGYSYITDTNTATAVDHLETSTSSNNILISGGTIRVDEIYAGNATGVVMNMANSIKVSSSSNSNKIKILGGDVIIKNIDGGFSAAVDFSANQVTAESQNNSVVLCTGKYEEVRGGYVQAQSYGGGVSIVNASNNTVSVSGDADLSSASLFGGRIDTQGFSLVTQTISGNSLIFGYDGKPWKPDNYSIASVNNFSTIKLLNLIWDKTIHIGTFKNASTDSTVTRVDARKVAFSDVDALNAGDSYDILQIGSGGLQSGSIALISGNQSENSKFTVGTTLQGTGVVSLSAQNNGDSYDTVTYTVLSSGPASDNTTAQPQTHAAAMTASAGGAILSSGADTTSGALSNLSNSGFAGAQSFSSVGGAATRAQTGSHISLRTLNLSVGIGSNVEKDNGMLSLGIAFETGYGRFKNHYDAGDAEPYISKNGHVYYYGLAPVANYAFSNGYHINTALRFGRSESSQSKALYDAYSQRNYDINLSSLYYGFELGAGRIFNLDERNSVDVYGRYFYLHQGGDSFNAGGKYHVHDLESHRLRLVGRYQHSFTENMSYYCGLGAEYEFDGESKLTLDNGVKGKSSETKGFRSYFEGGVTIKPEKAYGLSFDLGVKGHYSHDYRDIIANAEIRYNF